MKFEELNIDERILRAVEDMGFEEASPIQANAIPAVLEGRDVVGQAQTVPVKLPHTAFRCYRKSTRI